MVNDQDRPMRCKMDLYRRGAAEGHERGTIGIINGALGLASAFESPSYAAAGPAPLVLPLIAQ